MPRNPARHAPIIDEDSAPYWEAARRHEFVLPRCTACGAWRFPPQALCPHCLSDQFTWEQASGKGTIYTFSVVSLALIPDWADDLPYPVALIELDEGIKFFSSIVGAAPDSLRIGQPVAVVFEAFTEAITLPKFRPVGA